MKWLEDNKRHHLKLPLLELHDSVAWSCRTQSEAVTIPEQERLRLLNSIGAFDVALGQESMVLKNNNCPFRTTEQVVSNERTVKSRREKKNAEIMAKGPISAISTTESGRGDHDGGTTANLDTTSPVCRRIDEASIDDKTEREFFLQRGAIVSASIAEREKICSSDSHHHHRNFYDDGRPRTLCRISNCFMRMSGSKKRFFCGRHFNMIAGFIECKALARTNQNSENDAANQVPAIEETLGEDGEPNGPNKQSALGDTKSGEDDPSKSGEWKTAYGCSYCEQVFDTYLGAAKHEKSCGTVEEATVIPAPTTLPPRPPWAKVPISHSLTGEAKVLAEDYQYNVWKITMDYRKKLTKQPKEIKNEHVRTALGQERLQNPDEDDFHLPAVKYPSKLEELESVKMFRRCAGPLAATLSGRKKLVRKGQKYYGDDRSLDLCRVAGCQRPYSTRKNNIFLCDWHYDMIQRPLESDSDTSEQKKRKSKDIAFGQSRRPTKRLNDAREVQLTGRTYTVVAPPGDLRMKLSNGADLTGTMVSTIHTCSRLVKQISPGDRIIAIDGEDVSGMDVKEVKSIIARKIEFERRLEVLRGMPASSTPPKDTDAASAAEAREKANDGFVGNAAGEIANGKVSMALSVMSDGPAFGNAVLKAPAALSAMSPLFKTPRRKSLAKKLPSSVATKPVTTTDETAKPGKTALNAKSLSFKDTQPSTASSSTKKLVYATSQSLKYSSITQEKSSSIPSAMASEAPLEPADADISQFMSC
mmetsp:Transcript_3453/g.6155  ORF Transcript_3453/g.6155 Transcript_3453/m.6155 type:complete len:758 (-) Transcript_3453:136-2409(-)